MDEVSYKYKVKPKEISSLSVTLHLDAVHVNTDHNPSSCAHVKPPFTPYFSFILAILGMLNIFRSVLIGPFFSSAVIC